jgi:hypothetical protein
VLLTVAYQRSPAAAELGIRCIDFIGGFESGVAMHAFPTVVAWSNIRYTNT